MLNIFFGCSGLASVTIPNSVTGIGNDAFYGCSGLTSVTIGSGVRYIYSQAFASCKNLTDVYCLAEKVPSTNTDAFKDSYINYATLHVPAASINDYKTTEPWKSFQNFMTLEEQQLPKCATPTVSFDKSGLVFNCETPDVEYAYEIKNTDVKKGVAEGNRVELTPVYTITYYAMKAGYENSDVATATIRWRNGSPVFQGFNRVDAGAGALWGDVNVDGQVDVADIANIIDIMAGK
ncbi:MAG: leucine-rich repeat domain-containing protein [Prevotella sp.]|nr:leucine-rich repeat domain-containing protein [Prevotella sp.]